MGFTDLFIRRPVFATCLSLLLLIVGLISWKQLSVRQYPRIDSNTITITTSYTGANASTVESFITSKIEDSIQGVDGIDYMTSRSTAGSSNVTINLNIGADINSAMIEVQSDVSSVERNLPDNVGEPIIQEVDTDSIPEMIIAFSSASMTQEAISDYLTRVVLPQLNTLDGVGTAEILGNRNYAMRIWLNAKRMAQLGVSGADVQTALNNSNIQAQPGNIDRTSQLISITAYTDLSSVEEFSNIIVKSSGNQLVRLKDIAEVELGSENYTVSMSVQGKTSIGVAITPKSDANTLAVATAVKKALVDIKTSLPAGMTASIPRDASIYIKQSMVEVNHAIFEAALCVIFVIFIFIGSLRSIIIPIITIPLSLIGAFGLMAGMGYTINTITLLSFVLAIGMVVDDAIVVLENVHRHLEMGLSPIEAALSGAREISFAVIAMTLTLAAVYAPIGFTSGLTGALFKEFAFTLAGTVIISGFIALTLTPMMCSKIMRRTSESDRLAHKIDAFFLTLTQQYRAILTKALSARAFILIIMGTVFICGGMLFIPLYQNSNLSPKEDQGVVIGMARAPTGARVGYTGTYTKELAARYAKVPEATSYVIVNGRPQGENTAMAMLQLKNWSERSQSAQDIINRLMPDVQKIPGIQMMLMNPASLPGTSAIYPFQFVIKSTSDYATLNTISEKFTEAMEKNPGFSSVQSDLKLNSPQIDIKINRSKAAALGVPVDDIATALNIAFGEPEITDFSMEGLSYKVIPELRATDRNDPNKLNHLVVTTASGKTVPLSSLVTITSSVAPNSLNHFQGQRAATLSATLSSNYSTNAAITYLKNLAKQLLPSGMSYDYDGETRQFITESSSMSSIFMFALIFIYLILSAQFESFSDPFVVLFSVPLSLVGALLALTITNSSLNIYTEIALVTLIGLISKHGILIVEFANQLQNEGVPLREAALQSASVRLRPILMTTAAMVLGAFPLVVASGAGAVARSQMGWVICGGMTLGTVLTLFVVPTMYTFLARDRAKHPNISH